MTASGKRETGVVHALVRGWPRTRERRGLIALCLGNSLREDPGLLTSTEREASLGKEKKTRHKESSLDGSSWHWGCSRGCQDTAKNFYPAPYTI